MELFGVSHIAMLVLVLILCVSAVWGARRFRDTALEKRATRAVGWVLLALSLFWTGRGLLPAHWDIAQSLPLHLSDVLQIVTALALIARPGWAIAIVYYWALTLNLQSLLTPDLSYTTQPVVEFTMYWTLHIVVFLAPVVFTFGLGYRLTWTGYVVVLAVTVAWAGVAGLVNSVTGANYGYLGHPPAGGSLLDLLGPWPIYILWEGVVVATGWALMTWPWTRLNRQRVTAGGAPENNSTLRRRPSVLRAP